MIIYKLNRFSEPYVDNISHDIEIECSNKGICNHQTGECECEIGYEVIFIFQ